jgi:D-alanine-D-alanine ligase-like ATP-grasp enzyme/L-alanine-DL-glutamate epimerase-like enolase superfamily enzyme/acylphosphatase
VSIKVIRCTVAEYVMPLKQPFKTARKATTKSTNYLFLIEAEHNGAPLLGVGEAAPRGVALTGDPQGKVWGFLTQISRTLIGATLPDSSQASCIEAIREQMTMLSDVARTVGGNDLQRPFRGSLAGIEMALLDLAAKSFSQSVGSFLGGTREEIPISASTISGSLGLAELQNRLEQLVRRYPAWRVKGDSDLRRNIGILCLMSTINRKCNSSLTQWVDLNEALDEKEAFQLLDEIRSKSNQLEIQGKIIIEQPVKRSGFQLLAELQKYADAEINHQNLQVKIMADESLWDIDDWDELQKAGGCGAINIKIPKAGGLLAGMNISEKALAFNPDIEIYVGGMIGTSDIMAWGLINFAKALPRLDYFTRGPVTNVGANISDPKLVYKAPGSPFCVDKQKVGIGAHPDLSVASRYITRIFPEGSDYFSHTTSEDLINSYDSPQSVYFSRQNYFTSYLMEKEILAHGMQAVRLNSSALYATDVETNKQIPFYLAASEMTSLFGRMISADKQTTRNLLKSKGISIHDGRLFKKRQLEEAISYAGTIGYPVVTKPLSGKGGNGVTTNINNGEELKRSINLIKGDQEFIVEKHISGTDYRFVVTDDGVISAYVRTPASVVGDGTYTIADLVNKKNTERSRHPRYKYSLINLNADHVQALLKKQGFTSSNIPEPGETVMLSSTANVSQGGEIVEVLDEVHPTLIEYAYSIKKVIPWLGYAGLDLLLEDHRRPFAEQVVGFCEANSTAEISGVMFPSTGKPRNLSKALLEFNAKKKGIQLNNYRRYLSVRVQITGVDASDEYLRWIARIAEELHVHIDDCEKFETGICLVLTGWAAKVAAISSMAITPPNGQLVETVTTTPIETRVHIPANQELSPALHAENKIKLLIKGKVQGVGFRLWLQKQAKLKGIDGWVRNLSGGTVEAVLSGPSGGVNDLVLKCWQGPSRAKVTDIESFERSHPVKPGFKRFRTPMPPE